MVNWYIRFKSKKIKKRKFLDIEKNDIANSKKILFALFTRYGDTIIDLVVIKEFIEKNKNKQYLILCPKQMKPYVEYFLPNVEVLAFNKRNIWSFLKVVNILRKEKFDLGYSPWSSGDDSCFWLSFCKKFIPYCSYEKPLLINHYEIVRKYLNLSDKKWTVNKINLANEYKNILICPESTDDLRSLNDKQFKEILSFLESNFKNYKITIASMDKKYNISSYEYFAFSKSSKSSKEFIELCKNTNLAVCVDSAPLHFLTAINKDVLAIFNITDPKIVLNSDTKVIFYDK